MQGLRTLLPFSEFHLVVLIAPYECDVWINRPRPHELEAKLFISQKAIWRIKLGTGISSTRDRKETSLTSKQDSVKTLWTDTLLLLIGEGTSFPFSSQPPPWISIHKLVGSLFFPASFTLVKQPTPLTTPSLGVRGVSLRRATSWIRR